LAQRWEKTIPGYVAGCDYCGIYASPAVYNGNVIVATQGATLYDLSAADGSTVWKTTLPNAGIVGGSNYIRVSPTIDVDDGLVIIGTWLYNTGGSALYALRLSDGSIAWSEPISGDVRGAPVYLNGVVYQSWAGGDPPACINGGVGAFNAQTGATSWLWLTNPLTIPRGGGGIWGPIAWDGKHLVFGTGNTCSYVRMSQGAVALNTDGTAAWGYQVDADENNDDDTGGGVLVQNGTATFINKNGSLYNIDASSGSRIWSTALGAPIEHGGSATPTSDGSVIVVGAGSIPTSGDDSRPNRDALCWLPKEQFLRRHAGKRHPREINDGYSSFLRATNSTGSVIWSLPMTNTNDAYVAIANGVAFAPMDADMDAIALQTGTILAQFPTDIFEGGAVVVPSGLYMADYSGHVFAYSLPAATANLPARR
jgi:outer membrane protein assembly factor BamB